MTWNLSKTEKSAEMSQDVRQPAEGSGNWSFPCCWSQKKKRTQSVENTSCPSAWLFSSETPAVIRKCNFQTGK